MMKQKKYFNGIVFAVLAVLLTGGKVPAAEALQPEPGNTHTSDSTLSLPLRRLLPSDTVQTKLTFIVDSLWQVRDPAHTLDPFFSLLDSLYAGKDTVISIIHLGDSHIQAGYYSGRVMRLLQEEYGNAGRGWIAPFKLGKSNEPDDYFISSTVKEWTLGRCVQNIRKAPIGPGGIGILTKSPTVDFTIVIAPKNGQGYAFKQAVLYRAENAMPMYPAEKWKDSVKVSRGCFPELTERMKAMSFIPGMAIGLYPYAPVRTDTFRLNNLTDTLRLQSLRSDDEAGHPSAETTNVYYGFNLSNGKPGILYHAIGVNGARFSDYANQLYVSQLAILKPTLLIVSLGTNETFENTFTEADFYKQTSEFMGLIGNYMPHTAVLLTTPPECYKRSWVNRKRTYVRNANTEKAAKVLIRIAEENNIACWDLFHATGGKGSSGKWFSGKWMGNDRIHFNKAGYNEQGILLFKALMNLKRSGEEPLPENEHPLP